MRESDASNHCVPIFVVGVPRSGTTLLAAMLGGHPRLAASPETHFFSKQSQAELSRACHDPQWPALAVKGIAQLRLAQQPVIALMGLREAELRAQLSREPPTVAGMLAGMMALYSRAHAKHRWVEKTPNHLLHLEQIRAAFPTAPVVRIVRDARDCAHSIRALPWASRSAIANAYLIHQWHARSQAFFRTDARAYTLRYEDLIAEPERELAAVCRFIGEDFAPQMLDTQAAYANVGSANEPWKKQVGGPLDRNRAQRWKSTLTRDESRAIGIICNHYQADFAYDIEPIRTVVSIPPIGLRLAERVEPIVHRLSKTGTAAWVADGASPRGVEAYFLRSFAPNRLRVRDVAEAAETCGSFLRRLLKFQRPRILL